MRYPIPDLTPSIPLSYLIGVYFGDGCANQYQFIVQVADRAFADQCLNAIRQIGLRPTIREIKPLSEKRRVQWRVVAASRPFANWMKVLTIPYVAEFLKEPDYLKEFMRGFYESEGHAGQHLRKIRAPHARVGDPSYDRIYASTRLTMTNVDKDTLEFVRQCAAERGHELTLRFARKTTSGKDAFELVMTERSGIDRFLADIRPVIKLLPPDALPSRRSLLEIDGVARSVPEWARIFGMHPDRLKSRLRRGWSIERAIIP